ncbi:hypothetical protein ABZ372_32970, partial [Streptomyces sp. NPDC005921]
MASVEVSLKEMMAGVEGAMGAAVVDYTSGMALGTLGGGKDLDLTIAAAGNTDVIRAKVRTMEELGLKGRIEDILITLEKQYLERYRRIGHDLVVGPARLVPLDIALAVCARP